MTYTIFGNAGGVHLTLGAMTAKAALDRINTMRQCGAKLSSVQDGNRSYTEEELAEIAKMERGSKRLHGSGMAPSVDPITSSNLRTDSDSALPPPMSTWTKRGVA